MEEWLYTQVPRSKRWWKYPSHNDHWKWNLIHSRDWDKMGFALLNAFFSPLKNFCGLVHNWNSRWSPIFKEGYFPAPDKSNFPWYPKHTAVTKPSPAFHSPSYKVFFHTLPFWISTGKTSIFSTLFSSSYSAEADTGSTSSFLRSYSSLEYVLNTCGANVRTHTHTERYLNPIMIKSDKDSSMWPKLVFD